MWSYDPVYEQYAKMPPMPVVRTRFAATVAYNLLVVVRAPASLANGAVPSALSGAACGLQAGGYAGPTVLNDSMANTLNQTNTLV